MRDEDGRIVSDIGAALRALIDDVHKRLSSDTQTDELVAHLALWDTIAALDLHRIGVDDRGAGAEGDLGDLAMVVQALALHSLSTPLIEVAVASWSVHGEPSAPPGCGTLALAPHRADQASPQQLRLIVPWGELFNWAAVLPTNGADRVGLIDLRRVDVRETYLNIAGEPIQAITASRSQVEFHPGLPPATAIEARLGLLRTAALLGAIDAAHRATAEHVRRREQFGRPLIALPAVASSLALMQVFHRQAQAAFGRAVDAMRDDGDSVRARDSVLAARVVMTQAATEVATHAHQLHGAIGTTAEHPLGRITRRLWAWRDADAADPEAAVRLGRRALDSGEEALWQELTA